MHANAWQAMAGQRPPGQQRRSRSGPIQNCFTPEQLATASIMIVSIAEERVRKEDGDGGLFVESKLVWKLNLAFKKQKKSIICEKKVHRKE